MQKVVGANPIIRSLSSLHAAAAVRRLPYDVRGSATDAFIDTYRRAFAAFDAHGIADMFALPFQLTSDDGEIKVTTVPTRDVWLPQVERLVAAYRAIGVAAGEIRHLQTTNLTPQLTQVVVRWALIDTAGAEIYEFDAAYTLADLGSGLRITAIAHNETPHLRASLAARQQR